MKAVCKFTEGDKPVFRLTDVPEPQLGSPHEVKIRVESVGVCASDVHALHGAMHIPEGNIVGHEFAGTVAEVGEAVRSVAPGDRVVSELAIGACGECDMCRSGRYEFCRVKRPQGWVSPGVYAEYALSEERILHRIPAGVAFEEAALSEPLAICVYGCLERASIPAGASVVIYGMGSIGLLALIVLLDSGAGPVVCVAPTNHGRSRFDAAQKLGATRVVTPADDVTAVVQELTGRPDPDYVVDCSGAPAAINAGMQLLGKDGTFVALGIASTDTIPFAFNLGIHKALRLVFSSTSSHSSWITALGILERRREQVRSVVTHTMRLDEWAQGYEKLERREAIKVVMRP